MATPMSLEQQVASWFLESNVTLATAESCTGGLIAHRLTNVSGASGFYAGGLVAYSNKVKESLLGVPPEVLEDHGAVSPETAKYMAEGVRRVMGTDYGLAVTGIAGPNGGSTEKPVGLVYIAVARAGGDTQAWSRQFSGVRTAIKAQTAETALEMLLELFV